MKIDAHYYALLAFCRVCGFKKESAHKVAYASQFVDDARINHIVIAGNPGRGLIQLDNIDNQPTFFNMATCHSYTRMKTFNYEAMINNTCAFHFVPGCKGPNFAKKLRCDEESPVITDILREGLEQDELIKLGIVLHAYADTFSHQGFSGILSKVNDIKECKTLSKIPWNWSDKFTKAFKWFTGNEFDKLFDSAMPAYGHGQAMEYPDLPFLRWSYEYDYSDQFSTAYKSSGEIDNRVRYREAFQKIKGHLENYLQRHPQYRDEGYRQEAIGERQKFAILFDTLLTEKTDWERVENWQKTIIAQGLFERKDPACTYDENEWLREAFANFEKEKFNQRKVEGVILAANFSDTNWYKYYLAVKWYKEQFFSYCSQAGLEIPR
ncbi:MAG: hypothetical protein QMD03_01235 [Syntrophales bacterium]|nr:hypothetical protein [Syntrophales bacterium]